MKRKFIFQLIIAMVLIGIGNSCQKEEPAPKPEASFSFSTQGATVTFSNFSNNASSFVWSFGDGETSTTDGDPTHTYDASGTYSVVLVATGDGGTDTETQTVTVTLPSTTENGSALFWIKSDFLCGNINVAINNVSKTISKYSSSAPDCDQSGFATFTLSPGVYSYSASCTGKTWSGSLTISSSSCSKIELSTTTSGGTTSLNGIWVRNVGTSGDETDIAIGGIAGEPENRVYMCEWKGAVGLYKGYLIGNTITWDDELPDAYVRIIGNQMEFSYPSVSYSIPTMYNKGSWSNHCGSLSANTGGGESTSGSVIFWSDTNLNCGYITVNINGQSGTISQYYSSGAPTCGANGCANFTLTKGTYNFSASCSEYTWNGTVTVNANACSTMNLH